MTSSYEKINIWAGTNVNATVKMTVFPADGSNATDTAVIVCPGGSYFWRDRKTEGAMVARWLQAHGITAFLLNYRVAGVLAFVTHYRLVGGGNKHPFPIQDAQRAIQYIRENAKAYNINPDKVGIMGFSAGGHLALFASEQDSNGNYLSALGITTEVSLIPSFCAAIYPVVTLSDERYTHKRSRRALLGERQKHDREIRNALSLEKNVHSNMPPIFLTHCVDDRKVVYQNSLLLHTALTACQVPHSFVTFQTGGHGFGASDSKGTTESRQWRGMFMEWLTDNGFLSQRQ